MHETFEELTRGSFDLEKQNILLDFGTGFSDPVSASMTILHEKVHHYLTHLTDFGLVTLNVIRVSNTNSSLRKQFEELRQYMHKSQLEVQESAAVFMQMQHLRRIKGKQAVDVFVNTQFPKAYADRFKRLQRIFDSSRKYQDGFTSKIPLIAMQTGFRQKVVEQKITSLEQLEEWIHSQETPNERFDRLLIATSKRPSLLNSSSQEICQESGIEYFEDASKAVVSEFMNTLLAIVGTEERVTEADIRDGYSLEELSKISDEGMVITNLNMNLSERAELLLNPADLLHYADTMKAIMISHIGDELEEEVKVLEAQLRRKFDSSILAFTREFSRYLHPTSVDELCKLVDSSLAHVPFLVKWGIYDPAEGKLSSFKTKRRPDVVIYNTPKDLVESFVNISVKQPLEYLLISSDLGHPFKILVIKDKFGVIRYLNLTSIGEKYVFENIGDRLASGNRDSFKSASGPINVCMQLWSNLDEEYDWFGSLKDTAN